MARTPGTLLDGMLTAEAGVDSGFAPSLLQPNQLAWAVNTTVRGGFPEARPGWWRRSLAFPQTEAGASMQAAFATGRFQGCGTYRSDNGQAFLAVAISGRLFLVSLAGFVVQEITIPGDLSDANAPHAWFIQAENYLIVQDNLRPPVIYDGAGSRRANSGGIGGSPREVPVGGPMAYGKGRLWVARGSEYFGGDLVWSDATLGRGTILRFSENDFLNEGGAFAVPQGPITGMAFAANLDTSLGDGDLLVFTPRATFAFNAPVDRTVWKDLEYPVQRFALLNFGSVNHESIVPVNGDLFFRATDGVRSLIYARRDFTEWGNAPVSRQVRRALLYDTYDLLSFASAAVFDNRLLMTTVPKAVNGRGTWHAGLVVMDFDLVSGMGRKLPPAWEGVWTGEQILRLSTTMDRLGERCFAWCLRGDSTIGLTEITRDGLFDFTGDRDVGIQWVVETRGMVFGQPDALKRLDSAETWYDKVAGDVSMDVRFKPNENECWSSWGLIEDCARYKDCEPGEPCKQVVLLKPAARSRISFPAPPSITDPQSGRHTREGFEFQLRFENVGRFRLKRLAVGAVPVQQSATGDISRFQCAPVQISSCQTDCLQLECAGVCSEPPDYGYVMCPTPVITGNPTGGTVNIGQPLVLTGSAEGFSSLQWTKDGVDIPGANLPTLDMGPMDAGDVGSYILRADNACGSVFSTAANIAADFPPEARILLISSIVDIEGEVILLWGDGTDLEGPIVASEWSSDIDGVFGSGLIANTSTLTPATHQIQFRVQDASGNWSAPALSYLVVLPFPLTPDPLRLQVGAARLTVIGDSSLEGSQAGLARMTVIGDVSEESAQSGVLRVTIIAEV